MRTLSVFAHQHWIVGSAAPLLTGPYYYLVFGVLSCAVGVVSMCTGVTWARFGRVVYRAKQPREFWEDVITCYLIGVCFIGIFLYKVYAP
jgi:Mn2+/Fe2+ NRAMP family transporter